LSFKFFRKKSLIVEILKQSFKNEESDENSVSKDDAAKESIIPLPAEDVILIWVYVFSVCKTYRCCVLYIGAILRDALPKLPPHQQ
jgi:hypothetical protein